MGSPGGSVVLVEISVGYFSCSFLQRSLSSHYQFHLTRAFGCYLLAIASNKPKALQRT